MVVRQLTAVLLALTGALVAPAFGDEPGSKVAPADSTIVSAASESACRIAPDGPATGTGYFDLRQNQYGCWPNESLPTAGPIGCAPAACDSSAPAAVGTSNPCGE